jgi:hypothetical protein
MLSLFSSVSRKSIHNVKELFVRVKLNNFHHFTKNGLKIRIGAHHNHARRSARDFPVAAVRL